MNEVFKSCEKNKFVPSQGTGKALLFQARGNGRFDRWVVAGNEIGNAYVTHTHFSQKWGNIYSEQSGYIRGVQNCGCGQ